MGKAKKRYNWKSRQIVDTVADNTDAEKIPVVLDVRKEKYDASNLLVLPSTKRKTKKVKHSADEVPKPLSKKQRKKLETVVERKKKKINRAQLLEDLQKFQATADELQSMASTAMLNTKGLKRFSMDFESSNKNSTSKTKINSIKRSKKDAGLPTKKVKLDDNVLGFAESSESEVSSNKSEIFDEIKKPIDSPGRQAIKDHPSKDEETCTNKNAEIDYHTKSDKDQSEPVVCDDQVLETTERIPAIFIPVHRSPDIQAVRNALPIIPEEHAVMEAVTEHPVIIVCGETGSGKTTQVPQFLYEAGYASNKKMIAVTEPRRVAAVSISGRVAEEMSLNSSEISYQIRFEGNVTDETKIKFMTDGVLLKEIESDFLLTKYSAVIIDEAHERSVYSDILIGLLSRIVPLRTKRRNPLKLIIMSATLRVEDFTDNHRLFKVPPPVIKIESRQYPVSIHFNKRTPTTDYLNEVYRKVCKIHSQQPDGGILVFVTGQQEVLSLCRKLRKTFPLAKQNKSNKNKKEETVDIETKRKNEINEESDDEWYNIKKSKTVIKKINQRKKTNQKQTKDLLPKINLDNYAINPLDEEALQEQQLDEDLNSETEENESDIMLCTSKAHAQPMYVLPLFSMLPPDKQRKVFSPPPNDTRLCVIATNVAETSLTIPNIKYVVDTGKVKTRVYDKVTGISAFIITWTSKASANQRAGRAGRTGPGHCYRLYSSSVFNDEFPKFSPPEITRRPVDDILLQMKALGINKVVNFPFPSPPEQEALKAAEKRLVSLGALEEVNKSFKFKHIKRWEWSSKVTPLGQAMSCFPISPRFAKMLALSNQHDLLPYVIAIVSAMAVQEVFLNDKPVILSEEEISKLSEEQSRWIEIKKTWAGKGHSLALGDVMVLLKAVGACEYMNCTTKFCYQHGLRHKAMVEIRKLRVQLTNEVNLILPELNLFVDPKMEPPKEIHAKLLRQVILSGLIDHVARKIPDDEIKPEDRKNLKHAYKCLDIEDPVFIHPKSVLFAELPCFVVYQEIFESSKLYMKVVTAIEPEWLPVFAPKMCTFSKPLDKPPPRYNTDLDQVLCHVTATFGQWEWPLESVEIEMPLGLDRYRWFAQFFLEGQVCPSLKKYLNVILSPPVTMVKSWSRLQPRTEILLQALVSKQIDSKKALSNAWKDDTNYLLKEYCLWLPESLYYEVKDRWPPNN